MSDAQNTAFQAWVDAEDQVTRKLAELAGMVFKKNVFVGDSFDMEGRYDMFVFSIEGGNDQDQGFQSGCSAWYTVGRLYGVFLERRDAQRVAGSLMNEQNMPFLGDDKMPNVAKVFLREHPRIHRERRVVANSKAKGVFSVVECVFGVVYQVAV